MALFQKRTAEQKAEQERVNRNIWGKTFLSAFAVGSLVLVLLSAGGHGFLAVLFSPIAFFATALVAGILISSYENDESKKRLAELERQRREDEDRVAQAAQQKKLLEAQQKKDELIIEAKRQADALEAQKRKDDREYLLRKLTNTNTFVDLYDPAKADLVPRVKLGISTDLSDILRKHPRAELAEVMKREPDVCGMVVSLGEHLHAKGIRSAEASQILAALP